MNAFAYATPKQGDVITPEKVDQETFRSLALELEDNRRRVDGQIRLVVVAFAISLFILSAAVVALWIVVAP